jgi:hypothetical protein
MSYVQGLALVSTLLVSKKVMNRSPCPRQLVLAIDNDQMIQNSPSASAGRDKRPHHPRSLSSYEKEYFSRL